MSLRDESRDYANYKEVFIKKEKLYSYELYGVS